MPKKILYYDANCWLCRQLAFHTQRRFHNQLSVFPWTGAAEGGETIVFVSNEETYHGVAAWRELLREDPRLGSLSWLARKLGFEAQYVRTVKTTAEFLRRFCWSCPKR